MTPDAGGNPAPSPLPEPAGAAPRRRRLHRVDDRRTHAQLRRARRVRRGALTLSCVPEPDRATPRVAFAIGRNVGRAVHRNRARRRLRALMSELAPDLRGRAWLVGAGAAVLEDDYRSLKASAASAVRDLAGS